MVFRTIQTTLSSALWGVYSKYVFIQKKLDKCLHGEVCKYFLSNSPVDCHQTVS